MELGSKPKKPLRPAGSRRSWRRMLIWSTALTALLGYSLVVFVGGLYYRGKVAENLQDLGMNKPAEGLRALASSVVRSFRDNLGAGEGSSDLELLVFDVKHKHMTDLLEKRAAAMAHGTLEVENQGYVPAEVRTRGKIIPVKVRLKGDNLDHLKGSKWSLRVKASGDDTILGLRRFSVQHPRTRGYQWDVLFQDELRRLGVLSVRHQFVNMIVNGESRGIMDLEEHFSKELLESQARREGVIFSIDDLVAWQWLTLANEFLQMPDIYPVLTAFDEGNIAKDPVLTELKDHGLGLFRGFIEGTIPAHEVFDVDLWGRFLACCEVWDTVHSLEWCNIRFYLNPVSGKFEPIGYDSFGDSSIHHSLLNNVHLSLGRRLLVDPIIRASFLGHLHELATEMLTETKQAQIGAEDRRLRGILSGEFPLVTPLDVDRLVTRAKRLLDVTFDNYSRLHDSAAPFPQPLEVLLTGTGRAKVLEIANLTLQPVEISAIELSAPKGKPVAAPASLCELPIVIPARPENGLSQPFRLELDLRGVEFEPESYRIHGLAGVPARPFQADSRPYAPLAVVPTLPLTSGAELQSRFPFLQFAEGGRQCSIPRGQWNVSETIVLPQDVALNVAAGATLRFRPGTALVVRGGMVAGAEGGEPVVFEPDPGVSDPSWQGIFVAGGEAGCEWHNVTVRRTSGVRRPGWPLTGGVTIYRTSVVLRGCRFEGNQAEDALNCIQSEIQLIGVEFSDTRSDALDCDFCRGEIVGGAFQRIGGDGIDVSGTHVDVRGVQLDHVRDKAVSVGEGSEATISEIQISDCGTGVASKDGSLATLRDVRMTNIQYVGVMAYAKKLEFGSGRAVCMRVRISAMRDYLAQTGSRIEVDGTSIPTEDVDVDALYKTGYMKK